MAHFRSKVLVDFLHYVKRINCLTGATINETLTTNKYIYTTKYDPPQYFFLFRHLRHVRFQPYLLKILGSVSSDSEHTNTCVAFSFSLTVTIMLENISIRKDVKCRVTTALPVVLSPGDLTFFQCSSYFYHIFFKGRVLILFPYHRSLLILYLGAMTIRPRLMWPGTKVLGHCVPCIMCIDMILNNKLVRTLLI